MDKKELFEQWPIPKAVFHLAMPTTVGMLVMVFYNLVDTYFIGQTNDPAQVAAVSLGMPYFLFLMACGNLFGLGASSSISRYLGAGLRDRVRKTSSIAFWMALVLGVTVGVTTLFYMDNVVAFMAGDGGESALFLDGYLTWLAMGAPFMVLCLTLGNIVRSDGNAKIAMIGMIISTVTNIFLDPIFIFTLDFGVQGAAMATVVANSLAVLYFIVTFARMKDSDLSLKWKDCKVEKVILRDIFSVGTPAALNNILSSFVSLVYNAFLIKYGTTPVAAMGIVLKLSMLYVMLFTGVATGVQPLLGYNFGAKNYARMKEAFSFLVRICFVIGIGTFFLFERYADLLVGGFLDDPEVIAQGAKMLRVQVTTAPVLGYIFAVTNLMQVANKGKVALLLSVCRQGVIFLPAIIILDQLYGLDGVIWIQPVVDVLSVAMAVGFCTHFLSSLNKKENKTATLS